jgi:hypothetical protein
LKGFTFENSVWPIEIQDSDCRLPNGREGSYQRAGQLEVIAPMVRSRIEEPGEFSRAGSNGTDVRPLGAVAKGAGQTQVVGIGRTTMLFRDDVIDLATQKRVLFVDQTVFAQVICPRFHKTPEFNTYITCHGEQCERARAFANRIMCSSLRK